LVDGTVGLTGFQKGRLLDLRTGEILAGVKVKNLVEMKGLLMALMKEPPKAVCLESMLVDLKDSNSAPTLEYELASNSDCKLVA
jgi:hypothetical protein